MVFRSAVKYILLFSFKVGWARADCNPGTMLGADDTTWAFDGYNVSISGVALILKRNHNESHIIMSKYESSCSISKLIMVAGNKSS